MLIGSHLPPPPASIVTGTCAQICTELYRTKLPEELRELFRAKGPEALQVLTRCLRSTDERIAIAAATAILDRGYGKPTQTIDANINEETVRYYAEVPMPAASTEEWLENI